MANEGDRVLCKDWAVALRREKILLRHVQGTNWITGNMEERIERTDLGFFLLLPATWLRCCRLWGFLERRPMWRRITPRLTTQPAFKRSTLGPMWCSLGSDFVWEWALRSR